MCRTWGRLLGWAALTPATFMGRQRHPRRAHHQRDPQPDRKNGLGHPLHRRETRRLPARTILNARHRPSPGYSGRHPSQYSERATDVTTLGRNPATRAADVALRRRDVAARPMCPV